MIGACRSGFFLNEKAVRQRFDQVCHQFSLDLSPDAIVEDLPVGQQQWVEIIKVLLLDVRILILDEPTAVLTPQESDRLLSALEQMRAGGMAIVLVSHKLREVMRSDRVSVLRSGRLVDSLPTSSSSPAELSILMVGRELSPSYQAREGAAGQVVLDVENLVVNGERGHRVLDGMTIQVRSGEIVGLAGVAGNGQKELFEAIMRVRPVESGRIAIAGMDVSSATTREVLDLGTGHIPDDRFEQGLIGSFSIADNIVLGRHHDPPFRKGPFRSRKAVSAFAAEQMEEYRIVAADDQVCVDRLSGGNAQKVILARELERSRTLLLANQPTRGLDIGVIDYVYRQLLAKRAEGFAILLASEELDDLFALCDRIAVMHRGRVVGMADPSTTSMQQLGLMMAGHVAGEGQAIAR
jgi:simple sugar transport system ATP-binding protein